MECCKRAEVTELQDGGDADGKMQHMITVVVEKVRFT